MIPCPSPPHRPLWRLVNARFSASIGISLIGEKVGNGGSIWRVFKAHSTTEGTERVLEAGRSNGAPRSSRFTEDQKLRLQHMYSLSIPREEEEVFVSGGRDFLNAPPKPPPSATPIIEENATGNQGTLGPPILNPAGSISANSEIEEMESAVSLTSGTCGPQTPANATQSPTSDVTTIDIQLDTGLLRHLGISKEDVGRLITELLVHYAQGTLNLRSAIPQDVPNEGTGTQPTPDCKMAYHPPSNDFTALNDPQGKENASLGVSQATLTSEGNGFLDHVSQLDNWQTPETLLADLECRTAKVVYARLMGKDSNAVVITFEGTRLPKKVVFSRQIFNVKPYRPRPIVCYNCHGLGHMTDVCPCHERGCGCCGYIHEEDMEDCKRQPQYRNCNGPHVATSKDCPKRKIPGKKSSQPREPLRPQRTSYVDAIKVVDSTQSTVQVNSCDPSGSQERASTDWVPDWAKIIANENKPKPQPQLTETKEKDPARVDERYATKAELKRIETKVDTGFGVIFQVLEEIRKDLFELKKDLLPGR
ncbi:hypothetical protein HPB47_001141 [Ixodes persulcatus]|uniref:Uncharacterized protein n=1 Tax=Ixodes persulcatus TaxID=34615 RepID=A0AC60PPW4_IXOPE|nr:hypothetical protein HPB47_001141 [Ixodes persulcatus]